MTEALTTMREAVTGVSSALSTLGLMSMGAQALGLGGAGGGVAAAVSGTTGGGGLAALGSMGLAAAPFALGAAALGGVGYQLYSDDQRVREEEARRDAAQRMLAQDPSLLTPENLANATGDGSLIGPAAQRRRAARAVRSAADENMAAFRGGSTQVSGEVSLSQETVQAIVGGTARAIDRGAPAAGREPGEPGRRR